MRSLVMSGLSAGMVLAASAFGANAMPAVHLDGAAPLVETVAMGCGPGFFRNPRGFCRPMLGRPAFGPRRFYGPRPPFGPRRFYGPPRPFYRY